MVKKAGKGKKKEKKKDKKKDNDATKLLTGPENQARENYRELLLARVSEKQLQERISRVSTDFKHYKDKQEEVSKQQRQDIQVQYQQIRDTGQKLNQEKHAKEQLQDTIEEKKTEIKSLLDKFEIEKQEIKKKHDDEINFHKEELFKLNNKYIELANYEKEKEKQKIEIEQLKAKIEELKYKHNEEIANLEREKIQSNDNLKKEMLTKIKQTKTKLMALNDQQIHTTTKLTILENSRLTQELEYQSKQTEKLLQKQNQLQEQVQNLKREIDVHKQIESELAKRSHQYQKIIQRLQQKLKQIEETHNIQISNYSSIMESQDQGTPKSFDTIAMESRILELESQIKNLSEDFNQANKFKNIYKAKMEEFQKPLTDITQILRHYLLNFKKIADQDISSEEIQRIMETPVQE